MKTINIELTDKQYCLLTRIAKAEKRKLADLIYMILAEGLYFAFCETPISVEKTPDEYSADEKKQLAKNDKLEKGKEWESLSWDKQKAKGFEHVCKYQSNGRRGKDFLDELRESVEDNIYKEGN